ncbi:MAG: mechanosensitive ion channel family protein [Acidobacteriota bacterium]|nr:mechanosensitive ion channel family protein [Acidobacteriota bacterium]
MQYSDLRKKSFLFFIFAGIIIILLIILPFVEVHLKPFIEIYLKDFISSIFGSPATEITSTNAEAGTNTVSPAQEMGATAVSLFVQVLRIIKVILWMSLIIAIVRFANFLIFNTAFQSREYKTSSLLRNVFSIIIYITAFFVVFSSQYPTVNLGAFFQTSTILAVILGLALQDTLGNLFAGLAIQADQPFQTGDVVTIPNKGAGVVESISWRGVKIRTFQNKLLVISNSVLGKESIEIAPRENLNARIVFFNTLYAHSPAKTIQIVREAVRQVENVSPKIRPIVRVRNLGDNGLDFEVKYWIDDYTKFNDTDALIRQRVWYVFQREKIQFAYPTRTIHTETKLQENVFVETGGEIHERINNVSIFAPLSDEESKTLAENSQMRVFAPDEKIVRQGQKGNSMFVIHRGAVTVRATEDGVSTVLRNLREGDFFGEMGLLTGEPRTATVIATEETEVLEINNLCLKPILEENPALVKTLSQIVAERRLSLDKLEAASETREVVSRESVFNSIKKFFGLD